MVEKISELKNQILEQIEQDMGDKGPSRIDPKAVDMVKDLAEAEKSCWMAEYYRSVTEAMEDGSMGYEDAMGYANGGQGQQGGSGYRRGYSNGGQGYRGQSRDSMGRYTSRRGYRGSRYGHTDMMQEIRQMMETADPQEKERLKMQLRQMTEM